MKFIMALFFMGLSFPCFADIPVPLEKPSQRDGTLFQNIIDLAVGAQESSIILPPKLPQEKKTVINEEQQTISFITPQRKPLHIRTIVAKSSPHVIEEKKSPQDRVVIRYRGNTDDRMAGGSKTKRTYAERRSSQLKETSEKSPFKTIKLPRAGKPNMSDPVILFFKEQSSDIEVGQLSVLKSDILQPMKRYKNKKAIIYGYAERNKKDKSKTHQLALARALIISDYLVDNRIADTRLEIRPMDDDTPISPKNRVDIVIYN